ncbi:hypothetical protein ACIA5D_51040 [Actinoplanes sp. NPDC051513]|uniref:hypothetical protein n=1 Tax=Actinoplanes sp. NPDC051513 TaxID=3363908 RepID=UPI003798F817
MKWVNESGGVYANYWSHFLADDHVEDSDLVDLDDEELDVEEPDGGEDDPLDLLDELGIL